jgi:hypothetical protein
MWYFKLLLLLVLIASRVPIEKDSPESLSSSLTEAYEIEEQDEEEDDEELAA